MKLVVVSGRSGSGKSTALNALEDFGFQCIDNLPVSLLRPLAEAAREDAATGAFAVSIDARNVPRELDRFPEMLAELRAAEPDTSVEVIYLDADPAVLVRRFSETRRRHPLSGEDVPLREALEKESQLLVGIAELADLVIDTTHLTLHELREDIRSRVARREGSKLSLMFRSFGFRGGVPVDADMVFDVRCLPNPHWVPGLRRYTGRETEVVRWLEASDAVDAMARDIGGHLDRWLPHFVRDNRSYFTVAIGCTGGQHRSVYLAERLGRRFRDEAAFEGLGAVLVRHREIVEPPVSEEARGA